MTPYELVALLMSYVLVGAIAWWLSRQYCLREAENSQAKKLQIEAESTRAFARLCELRDQLRNLEKSLIHVQLLMEQPLESITRR